MNLYCLLLRRLFGTELLKEVLAVQCPEDAFKSKSVWNLVIPNSVEELNLRTRILFGSVTSLFTAALEGQKRQCLTIWSDVGIRPQNEPIESFFFHPAHLRLVHRPSPNLEDKELMGEQMVESSKLFFARSSVAVKSTLYTISE